MTILFQLLLKRTFIYDSLVTDLWRYKKKSDLAFGKEEGEEREEDIIPIT